jgi:rhodanese-related sulfurtransferase
MRFETPLHSRKWFKGIWQAGALLLLAASMGLLTNAMRPDRLPLISSKGTQPGQVLSGTDVVPLDEAEALYLAGAALFVDARPEKLYRSGHIKGAVSLPFEEFEARFPDVSTKLPTSATIVAYCDGDSCSLSHHLAQALKEKGYTDVRVLVNGWAVWRQSNLPVELTEGADQ